MGVFTLTTTWWLFNVGVLSSLVMIIFIIDCSNKVNESLSVYRRCKNLLQSRDDKKKKLNIKQKEKVK